MIQVHIWYPINSVLDSPFHEIFGDVLNPLPIPNRPEEFHRFGHGAIEFISVDSGSGSTYDDAYRAFWPGIGADWTIPSPGRVITSMEYDIREERSRPTRSITLNTGLNEALVYRYWYGLERQPLNYSFNGFNCCSSVAVSIRDGFPQHPLSAPPAYSPLTFAGGYIPWGHSNPYYLEEWVNEVNSWLETI